MVRISIYFFLLIGMAGTAQQPTPSPSGAERPSTDLSTAAPGHAGTTYLLLKEGAGQSTQTPAPSDDVKKQKASLHHSLKSLKVSGDSPAETSGELVIPATDLSHKTRAEHIARLAIMDNEPAPQGARITAHTTYQLLRPGPTSVNSDSQGRETPQSLQTLYGIPANAGSGLIAIVVAFHYATIEADLAQFDTKFALPACTILNGCLRVISLTPTVQCSWAAEAALDVQWIHALAPRAKILLVEAKTDTLDDMFDAVSKAAQEVKSAGGGLVSMSWASEEFSGEENYDKTFIDGALYVASSGDVGGLVTYPAASPRVISVGGTSLIRDNAGQLISEIGWNGSGGGYSSYETLPPYQQGIANISTGARSIPDISANADPYSGVSVWIGAPCSGSPGLRQAGGTSLAAPIIAAMINVAGIRRNTSAAEVQALYANAMNSARVRDITSGTAGSNTATPGYDRVTGLGVPQSIDFDKQ